MLQINRLKIVIRTAIKDFGFDRAFGEGLNFIASDDNTCGKSSILEGIYYALGLEQIIGGIGEKVLTSVYKTSIEYEGITYSTLESEVYLEIYNGLDVITLYRTAKMENRESRLISVYYGSIADIELGTVDVNDMYVNMPDSATRGKGFHTFLESYLNLKLPRVHTYNDSESKLYLQLIFSGMFIEQKRGWADFFSGMPILGVKDAKQRVVEFILALNIIENEKRKLQLADLKSSIDRKWDTAVQTIIASGHSAQCNILNLPLSPRLLDKKLFGQVVVENLNHQEINEYIHSLKANLQSLSAIKPKVVDNYDNLEKELNDTDTQILQFSEELREIRESLRLENTSVKSLKENLETIEIDIANNKDAARLQRLGSEIGSSVMSGMCPTCNQSVPDTLLPISSDYTVMSIDENIKHLHAQRDMYKFAIEGKLTTITELEKQVSFLEGSLHTLRRLALSLRSDLCAVDEELSESVVYKKVRIADEIERLESFITSLKHLLHEIDILSEEWKIYLDEKGKLPKEKFTPDDRKKLAEFESNFKKDLQKYGYKSVANINDISISQDTYLPVIDNFDMKFDSSASDAIRAIWAFTVSLLQTSNTMLGNHPGVLIFDEPAQHSIVTMDMHAFFEDIINIEGYSQVIIGITTKDTDTRKAIESLNPESYTFIDISPKGLVPIENSLSQELSNK